MKQIFAMHYCKKLTLSVVFALIVLFIQSCSTSHENSAWFGLDLPPGLGNPHKPIIDVSQATPPTVTIPSGEENFNELEGQKIQQLLRDIVNFSIEDREHGSKVWGRVTGFPAAKATIDWSAEQFRQAGLQQVEIQEYASEGEMWWASNWQVAVMGSEKFGDGSSNIILESALPNSGSIIDGTITATVVNTGPITTSIPDIDVTGKIAVQIVQPERSAYSERTPTRERSQQLMAKGALAVINIVEQTGNMHVRDFSNCNGPCFNLGTEDGKFLLSAMEKADEKGLSDELKIQLTLQANNLSNLVGHNVIGTIPGKASPGKTSPVKTSPGNSEENIIINAHVDSWFDGAGDNADGLAVLIAMARHFSKPENQLEKSLVFVASGGHHSRGLNGPSNVVRMNKELLSKSVMMLNLEHVAQLTINPTTWKAENTEQLMSFGVSNDSPVLIDIAFEGMARYGFNLNPEFRTAVPGDPGGYRPLGIVRVEAIHSGAMYHTSGDVFDTISVPGLERAARFFTYFVQQASKHSHETLGREVID